MDEIAYNKARQIEDMCNTAGLSELEAIGEYLATRTHPTLQQNFMRIVIGFIQAQAGKKYFDDRNKATVEICKKLNNVLLETSYTFKNKIILPFI